MAKGQNIGLMMLLGGGLWFGIKAMGAIARMKKVRDTVPPPYTQGGTAKDWTAWFDLAMSVYGSVYSLWEPGGPFYGQSTQQVYDQVPTNTLYQIDWNDPYSYPQGYA